MAHSKEHTGKETAPERGARFFRNINALGAAALGGAALLIPGPNVLLASWAGLNVAQAGGWEFLRRVAKRRNKT